MGTTQRIVIGVVTSVAILALLDLLASPIPGKRVSYRLFDHFYVSPGVGGLVTMFIAALGGAYASKTRFVIPAVFLAAGVWIFVVYTLNSIGAAAGQDDMLAVASTNLLGLIFGIGGATAGAHSGTWLVQRYARNESVIAH